MRDKRRIDRIMQKLEMIFLNYCKQSFITTLVEIFPHFWFYDEDDTTENTIDKYIEAHNLKAENTKYGVDCVQNDILNCLHEIWTQMPDMRFMQLMLNIIPSLESDTDPESYVDDEEILEYLKNKAAYYKS